LGIPDYNAPEWTILATYTLADAEAILGPAVGILFHVYNAPECICFEFEFVYVDAYSEISSSPIYLTLADSWTVTIYHQKYKFSIKAETRTLKTDL